MKTHETRAEPIACTLGPGAYRERLAWITALNRSAVRRVRREGARLVLAYDPVAGSSVREMVRRDQECCAFLDFKLIEDEKELTLVITAPETAREALAVFDPLLTGSNSNGGGSARTTAAAK
jgi:hypothetical protein